MRGISLSLKHEGNLGQAPRNRGSGQKIKTIEDRNSIRLSGSKEANKKQKGAKKQIQDARLGCWVSEVNLSNEG